jgi:hypothetical protein
MRPKAANSSPKSQQTISSFFSRKRKSSPIDLTVSDDPEAHLPRAKRIKEGDIRSTTSSLRDINSSEPSSVRPQSLLSDDVDASYKGKGKVKGKGLQARSSFREKLKRRDLVEKERCAMQSEPGTSQLAGHSVSSLGQSEEDILPWEKGASGRQHRKSSVIGPAGLPCTPLEEAVSVADCIPVRIL